MKDSKHHTKLTAYERDLIAIWKGKGVSLREIARGLKRSHSTIIEEIKRNSFNGKYYVAIHAHAKAVKRGKQARQRHPLKDEATYACVLKQLRSGWSPEVIAGRLKKRQGKTVICHETVYAFIYSDHPEAQRLKLWEYLPRKQKKRKQRGKRKSHRVSIPDRVSIHKRPEAANKRRELGHWEGDTMEGRRIEKDGIQVNVDRLARKILAQKVTRIAGKETFSAWRKNLGSLPKQLKKTLTLDNGRENVKHKALRSWGLTTYFADPYSAWQKGSVEQAIGLMRRYLPKGTSLTTVSQKELDEIVDEVNNRPRKVLNYNTPNEVFNIYLNH